MMWIVYALISGVFTTLAIIAKFDGEWNYVAAFALVAIMYAYLGWRDIHKKDDPHG